MPANTYQFNYALDPTFKKICTNSNLERALLIEKKARFVDLAKLLRESIKEAEQANAEHSYYRKMELILRVVSVTSKVAFMALSLPGAAAATGATASSAGAVMAVGVLKDSAEMIVKAVNEELRVKDAGERYAKNKIDLAAMVAKNSKKQGAIKITSAIGKLWDIIDISKTIYDHYDAYQQGGDLNIQTASIKKQLDKLQQRIVEIDNEISGISNQSRVNGCQVPAPQLW